MSNVILTTERLVLRELTAADAPFILELTNDPDWIRFIGDRGIRDEEAARHYIESGPRAMYARHGFGLYAVTRDGVPIGMCGLLRREWLDDADIGFAFLPGARGAGYAREAAVATLEHARTVLNLERIAAIVTPGNDASIRLLEKLGMRFERMAVPPGDASEICVYVRDPAQ